MTIVRLIVAQVKRLMGTKDNWILVIPNLILLFSLAMVVGEIVTILNQKVLQIKPLLDILNPIGNGLLKIVNTGVEGLVLFALYRNRQEPNFQKLVALGSSSALGVLLITNSLAWSAYSDVSHPCYRVQPVDRNREIVVLMAKFKGQSDTKSWPIKLRNTVADTVKQQGVKFVELPETTEVEKEEVAKMLNDCYGAILTVWGEEGNDYVDIHYTNSVNQSVQDKSFLQGTGFEEKINPDRGIVDIPTFKQRMEFGGSTEYVVSILAGDIQLQRHNLVGAIQLFSNAIEIGKKDGLLQRDVGFAYNMRGMVSEEAGNWANALADYTSAIEQDPNLAAAFMNRGNVYKQMDKPDEALRDYSESLRLKPNGQLVNYNRGNLYLARREFKLAADDYTEAIKAGEADPELIRPNSLLFEKAYENRGISYAMLKEYDKAIADFDKTLQINPKAWNAYNSRGWVFLQRHELKKAQADFDSALAVNPAEYAYLVYLNRGRVYEQQGLSDAALSDYTRAINVNPRYAEAYDARGSLLHDLYPAFRNGMAVIDRNVRQAMSDLGNAIQLKPSLAHPYYGLGVFYLELSRGYDPTMENARRALSYFETYAKLTNNSNPQVNLWISKLREKLGLKPELRM